MGFLRMWRTRRKIKRVGKMIAKTLPDGIGMSPGSVIFSGSAFAHDWTVSWEKGPTYANHVDYINKVTGREDKTEKDDGHRVLYNSTSIGMRLMDIADIDRDYALPLFPKREPVYSRQLDYIKRLTDADKDT